MPLFFSGSSVHYFGRRIQIFTPELVGGMRGVGLEITAMTGLLPFLAGVKGLLIAMASGYSVVTDNRLFGYIVKQRGGVNSMLGTIGLVICALWPLVAPWHGQAFLKKAGRDRC